MKLECVVVSVGCDDYLAHTLPLNKVHFDRQVVVTTPSDKETRRVAATYNVECFVTDAFTQGGCTFNKGAGIQAALEHVDFKAWMLHMDADIVLPSMFRMVMQSLQLNEQFLYGCDRVMCPTYEHWMRFMASPLPQHEQAYVHVGPFPVGTRIMKQDGYIPLGFFQLFHRQAKALTTKPWYPTVWDTAASSDLHFAYKWPRSHRHLLPEIIAYHLATEDITNAEMGQNWSGRKTLRFGPKDPFLANNYRPKPKEDIHEKTNPGDVKRSVGTAGTAPGPA